MPRIGFWVFDLEETRLLCNVAAIFLLFVSSHGAFSSASDENAAGFSAEELQPSPESLQQAKALDKILEQLPETKRFSEVEAARSFEALLRPGKICRGAPCLQGDMQEVPKRSTSSISILVSFTMPKASLKELYLQAQARGARLVVRGLFQDSFKKTREFLQRLGLSVDIDPQLFDSLQVSSVPCFVQEAGVDTRVLQGNVTLAFALEQFRSSQARER